MTDKDDFAAFMDGQTAPALARLERGQVVQGKVVHSGMEFVFVDLGTRSEGRIPTLQLDGKQDALKVGEVVEATVVDPHAEGGPLLAVTLGADQGLDTSALEMAMESATPIEGRFSQAFKGGLEMELGGTRAFCPASQLDLHHVADLSSFVGQTARVLVIEVREGGRSVVVSRRRLLERERGEQAAVARAKLNAGDELDGKVTSLMKFGAFVDLGGVEGLVHISELSVTHVENVQDVVQPGEQVRVKVLAIEKTDKGERIKLSMKALLQTEQAAPEREEILKAEVVRHLPHGVIVKTAKGDGFVPARELGMPVGGDHRRVFPVGAELEVTLLANHKGKLRFSASAVEDVRTRRDFADYREQQKGSDGASMGGLQAALGKLNLGELPPGPPPAPKPEPVPESKPVPKPVPTPASERVSESAQASPGPATPTRTQPQVSAVADDAKPSLPQPGSTGTQDPEPKDADDKPRRRRIVQSGKRK